MHKPVSTAINQQLLFQSVAGSGAEFSSCSTYRYCLWRVWDDTKECAMFIGLNPSTADANADDPTIRRCVRFAADWGYGGIIMMNAYAFRATDPMVMKAAVNPVGPLNDAELTKQRSHCGIVIAAWGNHCSNAREVAVCDAIGGKIYCLGKTKSGKPRHPLYLRADAQMEDFFDAQA